MMSGGGLHEGVEVLGFRLRVEVQQGAARDGKGRDDGGVPAARLVLEGAGIPSPVVPGLDAPVTADECAPGGGRLGVVILGGEMVHGFGGGLSRADHTGDTHSLQSESAPSVASPADRLQWPFSGNHVSDCAFCVFVQ